MRRNTFQVYLPVLRNVLLHDVECIIFSLSCVNNNRLLELKSVFQLRNEDLFLELRFGVVV